MAYPNTQSGRPTIPRLAGWLTRWPVLQPWHLTPLLALLIVVTIPFLWMSLVASPNVRVDVGIWGDHTYLSGVHDIERSSSEDYRWTTDRAELVLPNLSDRYRVLELRAHGWRPDEQASPLVRVDVDGAPIAEIQTTPELRVYQVLLPESTNSPVLRIGFESDIYVPAGDPRQVGFAIDWIAIHALGQTAPPSLWHLVSQIILLSLLAVLIRMLVIPRGWAVGAMALLCGGVVWANMQQPLWISQAIIHWLIVTILLLFATWWLAPRLHKLLLPWMSSPQAGVALALFIVALALRLAGSSHPLFNSRDVDVHMRWLDIVEQGQLYLYSTPGELRNQQTFNPPAGYVLLMPLTLLLPSARLVVQTGVGLIDAIGCLLLLPIARELRLPARAALLAMALYIALPINTTMLWWGFATNAMAQTFWLLLLWLLLRLVRKPDRPALVSFVVVSAVTLMTHVGALVLLVAIIGFCVVFGWRAMPPEGRRALVVGLALALLVVVPIYFTAAAAPIFAQSRDGPGFDLNASLAKGWADRELRAGLVSRGFVIAFLAPILALAPFGIGMLITSRERHPLQRTLVIGWILVCVTFIAVYMSLGYMTRYIYFITPLVCLAVGALLASIQRRRVGRLVALVLVLFIIWSGSSLWTEGVLLRVKPSLVSLTH
ncbi:MAG: glycosyltransferase family 39 protein [Chloroflexota bacterium]